MTDNAINSGRDRQDSSEDQDGRNVLLAELMRCRRQHLNRILSQLPRES